MVLTSKRSKAPTQRGCGWGRQRWVSAHGGGGGGQLWPLVPKSSAGPGKVRWC